MSIDRIDVVGVNSGIYVVVPSCSYFNMECNQQCVWMSMMKIMFILCFRMANEKKSLHFHTSNRLQSSRSTCVKNYNCKNSSCYTRIYLI